MMQSNKGDGGSCRSAVETAGESRKEERIDAKSKENVEQGTNAKTDAETSSWPMKNVPRPGDNDVMCGRGAGTNYHPGNKKYRQMVEDRKIDYHIKFDRHQKKLIAPEIVQKVRNQNPPGRFLERNKDTGKWDDVGDAKAIDKTVQALRENGPKVRERYHQQQQTAANGANNPPEDCKPSKLKRGHSVTQFLKTTQKAFLERGKSISRAFTNTGGDQVGLLSTRERTMNSTASSSAADSWETSRDDSHSHPQQQQFAFGWPRVLSRPAAIDKRVTSHQNESHETKPSGIKKAALNRDQSAVSNRLKLQSFPDYFSAKMQALRLGSHNSNGMLSSNNRPTPITTKNRLNTYDKIEADLLDEFSGTSLSSSLTKESPTAVSLERPSPIDTKNRMNTYEQFEHDQLISCSVTSNTSELVNESPPLVSSDRPSPIHSSDRMTTLEQFEHDQLKFCSVTSDSSALIQQSPALVSSDRPSPINSADRMTTYEQFEHEKLKSCS